jgi:hypothetical protein
LPEDEIMRHFLRAVVYLAALPAFALAASAATVTPSGDVFVDRGAGYQQISGPTEVKAGDVVMAIVGSTATIRYSNGCLQPVNVGAVAVVSEVPPCAGDAAATGPGIDSTIVLGGLAVAGGVAAVIALSGGDGNDPPASP